MTDEQFVALFHQWISSPVFAVFRRMLDDIETDAVLAVQSPDSGIGDDAAVARLKAVGMFRRHVMTLAASTGYAGTESLFDDSR